MNFFRKQMYLKIFIGIILFFISHHSSLALTQEYFVSGGYDMTGDTQDVFTVGTENTHDTEKLRINDNNRIQSNGESWPIGTSYDERKYIEFQFSPNIPENAVIENVVLYHDFRRSSVLTEAKLKVINGNGIPQDFPIVVMPQTSNTDVGEIFNITQAVNTPEKINGMKVWFLAYRPVGEGGNTKTSHDMLRMEIIYSLSENPISEEGSEVDPDPEGEEEQTPEEPSEEVPQNPSQNLPPVTTDYIAYLSDGVPLWIELPFTDDNNAFFGMSLPDTPVRGMVNVIEANRVAYVPTGTPGPDSFRFRVNDGVQYSNFSTVYIRESRQSISSLQISFENSVLVVQGLDANNQLVTSDNTTPVTITIDRNGVDEVITGILSNGVFTQNLSEYDPGSVTVVVSSLGIPDSERVIMIEGSITETENSEEENQIPEEQEEYVNQMPSPLQNPEPPRTSGVAFLPTIETVEKVPEIVEIKKIDSSEDKNSFNDQKEVVLPVGNDYSSQVIDDTLESSDLLASAEGVTREENVPSMLVMGFVGVAVVSVLGFIYIRFIRG